MRRKAHPLSSVVRRMERYREVEIRAVPLSRPPFFLRFIQTRTPNEGMSMPPGKPGERAEAPLRKDDDEHL